MEKLRINFGELATMKTIASAKDLKTPIEVLEYLVDQFMRERAASLDEQAKTPECTECSSDDLSSLVFSDCSTSQMIGSLFGDSLEGILMIEGVKERLENYKGARADG